MIVKMKRLEQLAIEHGRRFTNAWDYYCVSSGAFYAGYVQAKQDLKEMYHKNEQALDDYHYDNAGNEEVEVDIPNGTHQLSLQTFSKWKELDKEISIKYAINVLRENKLLSDEELDILLAK